ncbi:MFS transporter [Mucilaginibacter sp.]|jgi:GPH family glycoside/pentoside/hexuronide:cation symporter|uniref:MFS transporter n=1 Tax=Mucilaginibacter sp. TaxID=1882438 RepID=UPI002BAEB244|nr:MFS transporter [Mucilaginibacter sp.]HTI57641.1 MFS transporter [Mucilaginibacter sp.]
MPSEKLTLGKELAYACGMVGWSIMTNIIIVMLPYFYLPPSNAGLVQLVPQLLLFGVINILSIIAASGRLADALYDPFIASMSDKSRHRRGRRIPFMQWAILPAVVFCCLTFYPLVKGVSDNNSIWLAITMVLFFMGATTYIIPYNALLPELTHSAAEKVKLSSFQQAGFVLGIIIAALVNNYADLVQRFFHVTDRDLAVQYTIWGLCIVAGLIMLVPVLAIDEKKYTTGKPAHLPIMQAIRKTFGNSNFKYYLISDFTFYISLSIVSSGLLYFVTVLLNIDESEGGKLMGAMVVSSLLFYPVVNYFSRKIGKKPLVLIAFGMLSLIFVMIYFLGKFPVSPYVQAYTLALLTAFPLAALGILPNAILAEIAEQDAKETGENREGMFFAVKYFFVKMGQTLGIALFAFLTVYGKDPGHDHGLRLNGVCGCVLCLAALIFFSRFKEARNT